MRSVAAFLFLILVSIAANSAQGQAAEGELQITVAGEAWEGPPRFRLWIMETPIAEADVSNAVPPQDNARPARSAVESAQQRMTFRVPDLDKATYIAVEFINDHWAGEGKVGDRNLWVKGIAVNGREFGAAELARETKAQIGDFIVLYDDGVLILDRPEDGWSGKGLAGLAPDDSGDVPDGDAAPAVSDTIDTHLVQIRRHSFDIGPRLMPDAQFAKGAAMAASGDRVMIAFRNGKFFEITLAGNSAQVRALPLELALHEQEFLEAAQGKGNMTDAYLRVLDLALIDGDRRLAASFTKWDPARECISVYLAVTDLAADWGSVGPSGWDVIYQSQPCMPPGSDGGIVFSGIQSGGRIIESKPGTLLLTIGDFAHDGVMISGASYPQDPTVDYGKIIEIDLNKRTANQLSIGHRNPQGLLQDSRGRLWETEHGPRGGDELNLIVRGRDYGWPAVTLGTDYGTHRWPSAKTKGSHQGYEWPVYAWMPSLGISNLIEVRNFAPEWNGDLLVASLSGEQLRRLRLNGKAVLYDEPIAIGARLRDIAQLSSGSIALLTDRGNLIVLEASPNADQEVGLRLAMVSADDRPVIQSCMQCHAITGATDTNEAKINLWGIYNRPIGAGDPENYSTALRSVGGRWDERNLDQFLRAPADMVPGTSMAFPGIEDDTQRRRVVDFLKALN